MMTQSPRIGINCDVEEELRPRLALRLEYPNAVLVAGGVPILIPPCSDVDALLAQCDGLLLTGGLDYRAGVVGREPPDFEPVLEIRERFDLELAARARAHSLPTLGICGGFQLLVVSEGGSLYGDLATEIGESVLHREPGDGAPPAHHGVEWRPVEEIPIAAGRHVVNSSHHQGIKKLPPDWIPLASSDDGLVEAACARGRFCVGIQWHPEREAALPLNRALFAAFLRAASAAAAGHRH